ncbi:unnamed protein product [Cuscuta epithymum]|uniref:Uncharacterized protein n=1 Tax=Cuscuta epithymum TaxID=186058 RepID=A0AAV0C794_9ASTE|nr:unnamed protein product [Cuscuta epithymum]
MTDCDVEALQKEVDAHVLFPPESDFSKVCSCDECSAKVKVLKEFEADLRDKQNRVLELIDQQDPDLMNCIALGAASYWTRSLLDRLHRELELLYEKSGASRTLKRSKSEQELIDVSFQISNMLIDNKLLDKIDPVEISGAKYSDDRPLAWEIKSGYVWYGDTRFKNAAFEIIKKIEEIENHHENDKKSAQEEERSLDPSISKKHIDDQIMLLKKLPVGQLHHDCQKFVPKVARALKADNDINSIYRTMIIIRRLFWKKYQMIDSSTSNTNEQSHSWSGLKLTLELLAEQANSFRELWDKEYDQHFGPYEGSDSKKQKTNH